MNDEYVHIKLTKEEKSLILDKAQFYIFNEDTLNELKNRNKKVIKFKRSSVTDIIGELSYYYNRSNNEYESMSLDELICHLECYEKKN